MAVTAEKGWLYLPINMQISKEKCLFTSHEKQNPHVFPNPKDEKVE